LRDTPQSASADGRSRAGSDGSFARATLPDRDRGEEFGAVLPGSDRVDAFGNSEHINKQQGARQCQSAGNPGVHLRVGER